MEILKSDVFYVECINDCNRGDLQNGRYYNLVKEDMERGDGFISIILDSYRTVEFYENCFKKPISVLAFVQYKGITNPIMGFTKGKIYPMLYGTYSYEGVINEIFVLNDLNERTVVTNPLNVFKFLKEEDIVIGDLSDIVKLKNKNNEGVSKMENKTYQTWEVLKALQENPNKRFAMEHLSNDEYITTRGTVIVDQDGELFNLTALNILWREVPLNTLSKADLKEGMIVEDWRGHRGIIVGDIVVNLYGARVRDLRVLNDQLESQDRKIIVKVVTLEDLVG